MNVHFPVYIMVYQTFYLISGLICPIQHTAVITGCIRIEVEVKPLTLMTFLHLLNSRTNSTEQLHVF